jgi:hypothetical protein
MITMGDRLNDTPLPRLILIFYYCLFNRINIIVEAGNSCINKITRPEEETNYTFKRGRSEIGRE